MSKELNNKLWAFFVWSLIGPPLVSMLGVYSLFFYINDIGEGYALFEQIKEEINNFLGC